MAVEAASTARRDGSPARRNADETRRRALKGADRMAPGRHRDGQGHGQLHLRPQPRQAADGPPARGTLSAAHQPHREDPALLWQYYIQLVAVEEAFKNLKDDLAIRPIFHQEERRIEAHIFISFLAYCLYITLQRRLHALAPGLTARSALEKFAAVQMIDVHLPTTDGRELLLTRYTQPEPELQLLIKQIKLVLPPQPPPKISGTAVANQSRP